MIYFTILALLNVLLNCEFDPYRQKLDPKEFEKKYLINYQNIMILIRENYLLGIKNI